MMGFTGEGGRRYMFYGTKGEMTYDEQENHIKVSKFGEKTEIIDVGAIVKDKGYGHGGGDFMLIESLFKVLNGETEGKTSLENSVESHLIGICAEKSRTNGGEKVFVHKK